jgi:hypothetical protein
MSSVYRGFDVITRIGIGSTIVIKAEMEKEAIQSLLGGDYNALFILDRYDVELYSRESLKGAGSSVFFNKKFKRV